MTALWAALVMVRLWCPAYPEWGNVAWTRLYDTAAQCEQARYNLRLAPTPQFPAGEIVNATLVCLCKAELPLGMPQPRYEAAT